MLGEKIHYGVTVLINLLAPQEAMAMMPMMGAMSSGDSQKDSEVTSSADSSATSKDAAHTTDETFDDVSVEDIKDEEEII